MTRRIEVKASSTDSPPLNQFCFSPHLLASTPSDDVCVCPVGPTTRTAVVWSGQLSTKKPKTPTSNERNRLLLPQINIRLSRKTCGGAGMWMYRHCVSRVKGIRKVTSPSGDNNVRNKSGSTAPVHVNTIRNRCVYMARICRTAATPHYLISEWCVHCWILHVDRLDTYMGRGNDNNMTLLITIIGKGFLGSDFDRLETMKKSGRR